MWGEKSDGDAGRAMTALQAGQTLLADHSYSNRFGGKTINGQGNLHLSPPGKLAREAQVELIKPDVAALHTSIENLRIESADSDANSAKSAVISKPGTVEGEEERCRVCQQSEITTHRPPD